jgi:hypothetical protein
MGMDKVIPAWLTLRPLDVDYRPFDLESMGLTGRTAVIQERKTCELERVHGGSALRVWLDPSQAFSVLRLLDTAGEKVLRKFDIRYRKHNDTIFLPTGWDAVIFDPSGDLVLSTHATVLEVELDPRVMAEEIQVEYPPGTLVSDVRSGTQRDYLALGHSGVFLGVRLSTITICLVFLCIIAPIVFIIWKRFSKRRRLERS